MAATSLNRSFPPPISAEHKVHRPQASFFKSWAWPGRDWNAAHQVWSRVLNQLYQPAQKKNCQCAKFPMLLFSSLVFAFQFICVTEAFRFSLHWSTHYAKDGFQHWRRWILSSGWFSLLLQRHEGTELRQHVTKRRTFLRRPRTANHVQHSFFLPQRHEGKWIQRHI